MELIERADFLAALQSEFKAVTNGGGRCALVCGEAGIGKTSVVRAFCSKHLNSRILLGSCDALFTPRPLGPLYDIALQLSSNLLAEWATHDRTMLFGLLLQKLQALDQPAILVFEDIHWADEATLDFIKFLGRRLMLVNCLLILTYRDNEIDLRHPLRSVLGQLPAASLLRVQLPPLSRNAVDALAEQRGYRGEDVFIISGGNPFYVNEILANYSDGVPDNVKDTILAVYLRQNESTRYMLDLLSVFPAGITINQLEKLEPDYAEGLDYWLNSRIVLEENNRLFFKHELYRRTIEGSISTLSRIAWNARILDVLLTEFEQQGRIQNILHHARNANNYKLMVRFAPVAAKAAAELGSHIEAAKLYYTAIEYNQEDNKTLLLEWYTAYAYESYLINQIKDAIVYQRKVAELWQEYGDQEKVGDALRFLSRLWWFEGNRKNAEDYATQAIQILEPLPDSRAKAMALSNMSQLKMLSNEPDECLAWGNKAIAIAKQLNDNEVLSHALNNVGTVQIQLPGLNQKGNHLVQEALDIALENGYQEHAARAYTNLGSANERNRHYPFAENALQEGIAYCRRLELDSWTSYMSACLARVYLATARWTEADQLASALLENDAQAPIVQIVALCVLATVRLRTGQPDALNLLQEAGKKAIVTNEMQRIIPVSVAMLEYEWIYGKPVISQTEIDNILSMLDETATGTERDEFAFWLQKTRTSQRHKLPLGDGCHTANAKEISASAAYWHDIGSPYEEALILFEGNEQQKKQAVTLLQQLGATPVYEKLRATMLASGIKGIPRGMRESTRANVAYLTERELNVIELLNDGLKNKEIAEKLFISAKTVDHHISSIFVKLNVDSRGKAVTEAKRLEIIK